MSVSVVLASACSSPSPAIETSDTAPNDDTAVADVAATDDAADTSPTDAAAETAPPAKAVDIAVGDFYVCALLEGGKVRCWGDIGNIGTGVLDKPLHKPTEVLLARSAKSIASGRFHMCAYDGSKTVECWGSNTWGQLGITPSGLPLEPRTLDFSGAVQTLSPGATFTCALLDGGSVECLGDDTNQQLGKTLPTDCTLVGSGKKFPCSTTPLAVTLPGAATQVSSNDKASLALLGDGGVELWGADGGVRPVTVANAKDVVAPSCVVLSDGSLSCWSSTSPTPTTVVGTPPDIEQVGVGFSAFTCVRTKSLEVWCWGANDRGQLGDGTFSGHDAPAKVPGLSAVRIAVGGDSACAITPTGEVSCWGRGSEYQLGSGSAADAPAPVRVAL